MANSNEINGRSLKVSITVSLFGTILLVALALAVPLAWYSHLSHRETSIVAAEQIMEGSAETIKLELEALVVSAETMARTISKWPGVQAQPGAKPHAVRQFLISQLEHFPHFSTISIGFDDGSFYMVGSAAFRPVARLMEISAPDKTTFIEQAIFREAADTRIALRRFLDGGGNAIARARLEQPNYDPRTRPWFIEKSDDTKLLQSNIYLFAGTGSLGLTVSHRHPSGTVGIDFTLAKIEEFLGDEPQAKNGVLAIVGPDATILASSAQGTARNRVLQQLVADAFTSSDIKSGVIDIDEQSWVVRIFPAPMGTATEEVLLVAEPLSVISEPVREITRNALVVSVLTILISIPLIWIVSRSLSRPLISLARDADSIRRFELDPRVPSLSIVDEIQELQIAMTRMRTALSVFSQYVPKALVQKLIQRNEIPNLGGERRDITVLFLDLENFTDMSSNLKSEEVMSRMSEFFEIVTQVLLSNEATIDKYIGDAVMAFWNAPEDTPNHEFLACKAALEIREAASAVTAKWTDAPYPLRTRIGIHSGEAVVGNVGSSDRMNYTALGSTVNIAARLEQLNRGRSSEILVSERIFRHCETDFHFNFAEETRLKGIRDPVSVYSLVAAH